MNLPFQRHRLHQPGDPPAQAAHAQDLLSLLLAQDGSTTRLCETIAGGPVTLQVLEQRVVHALPPTVGEMLPGTAFIERVTSLAAHGQVMMDNLSYIALEGLAPDLKRDLEAGAMPIGHLLARLWVRREFLAATPQRLEGLWSRVGLPDPEAARCYRILTPEGPRMWIAEVYRRGMLMSPRGPAAPSA